MTGLPVPIKALGRSSEKTSNKEARNNFICNKVKNSLNENPKAFWSSYIKRLRSNSVGVSDLLNNGKLCSDSKTKAFLWNAKRVTLDDYVNLFYDEVKLCDDYVELFHGGVKSYDDDVRLFDDYVKLFDDYVKLFDDICIFHDDSF